MARQDPFECSQLTCDVKLIITNNDDSLLAFDMIIIDVFTMKTTGNYENIKGEALEISKVFVDVFFRIFEQAIQAAGVSFKSDKLWDMYLLWEKDNKNLKNITKIYDRLLAIPTQLYSHHHEQ